MRPYLKKNPSQKRAAGVAQGVGPEFKLQYRKKKKKKIDCTEKENIVMFLSLNMPIMVHLTALFRCNFIQCPSFFFFVSVAGTQTQGLMLARQALY
jgi:hypothetical protein